VTGTITNWPITLEQFLALPEAEPALEMSPNGEFAQKVSPTTEHAALQRELAMRLEAHARPRQQGHAFTEQRVVLSRVARVPDVSFYGQERLPLDASGRYIAHPTSAPDLVAEIYSPGQEDRPDVLLKIAWYLDQGVRVALLVDPERRRVTVFSGAGEAVFTDDQSLPLEDLLPGLLVTPAELFAALEP
ncbi:MAG: Uma2 family endonuclease, partial [Chloroflexi bacterium]|nr:Uma2 family endonuclease [Chloroflexota bacterium]